VETLNLMRSLN